MRERERRRNKARERVQVETQGCFMGANHALCAYVCRCEILATFRNKARINNGRSLLCAAFHSPHLHQLYRKRECAWIENSLSLFLLFFFFFTFSRLIVEKREKKTHPFVWEKKEKRKERFAQYFSSAMICYVSPLINQPADQSCVLPVHFNPVRFLLRYLSSPIILRDKE